MEPPKLEVPISEAVPGLRSKSVWPIAAGNVSPRVVARIVRVVEGHAVPRHGVIGIDEAAEEDFGLTVADTVGSVADGAGGSLDDVREVGHGRSVLADEVARDLGAGRTCVKHRFDRRHLRAERRVGFGFNHYFFRNRGNRKRNRVLRLGSGSNDHAGAYRTCKSAGRNRNRIAAGR